VKHLEDAAEMAGVLWDEFLPLSVKRFLCDAIDGPDAEGRALLCWLAGVHDIGKASPDFAQQAPPMMWHLLDTMRDHGMDTRRGEKHGHATVGQVVLSDWMIRTYGCSPITAGTFACIVGGHHGINPTASSLGALSTRAHRIGTGAWAGVRQEILDRMASSTGSDIYLPRWLHQRLPVPAQVLLSGIVIMADWMSSDETRFPYADPTDAGARARRASHGLGLPRPWRPSPPPSEPTEHLQARFPALASGTARPLQAAATQIARGTAQAPLIIVEGPMGIGKTEAALMAAEVLAERFGQGGVFVGLPTMATSNPMFDRVLDWLEHSLTESSASVALSHGKAALNETYDQLQRASWRGQVYDDEARPGRAVVNEWLRGRKRAGLASFVVGTIDQSLFVGLKSKHLALRHLGLAGKVVIIDEVHAADDYMRRYLTRVLTWLGAYRTPVVLMSATLPPEQRDEFVRAYAEGLDADDADTLTTDRADVTPRITVYDGGLRTHRVEAGTPASHVTVKRLADDLDALASTLESALAVGGCAGVICNTVGRAQEAYAALRATFGVDVTLAHSRFVAPDRAQREADLVRTLGPGAEHRPERLVVVGSQVLEQSLDIDFDLLVSDLAPMDLVLQRLGRLHRHTRANRPVAVATPVLWLRGVDDWDAHPPVAVRGSQAVYGRQRLLRTAAVLEGVGNLSLPDDIPRLVRLAYDPALLAPTGWDTAWNGAEARAYQEKCDAISKASAWLIGGPWGPTSLNGWVDVAASDPDHQEAKGHSQVRDSDDGLEVIALFQDADGQLRLPRNLKEHGGSLIPSSGMAWGTGPDAPIARAMASCTLRLPTMMCYPGVIEKVVNELERRVDHSGWQGSPWIAGQLVLAFDTDGDAAVGSFSLHYDPQEGLTVTREESTR